ncbi:hypothetical protein AAF712_012182 [Marasmius tenuissimus]|uniref:Uncharacterized protein n=1 Tax=Marasmius tenuissimus TaxID=585030 RepID=A0ABR2ZIH5_9AGAR
MSLLSSVLSTPSSLASLTAVPTIFKTPSKKQHALTGIPAPAPLQVQMALGEGSEPPPPPTSFPPTPSPTPSRKRKSATTGRLNVSKRWNFDDKAKIRDEGRRHSTHTYVSDDGAILSIGSQQDILEMLEQTNATDNANYAQSSASEHIGSDPFASEHSTVSNTAHLNQTPGAGPSQLPLEGQGARDSPFEIEDDGPRKRRKLREDTKPPKCNICGMPEFEPHICELE